MADDNYNQNNAQILLCNLRSKILTPVAFAFLVSTAAQAGTPNDVPINLDAMFQSIQDACAKKMKDAEFIKAICRKRYHLKHRKCHYKSIKGWEVVAGERLYPRDNGDWELMDSEPFVPGGAIDFKGPKTITHRECVTFSVLKGRIIDPLTVTGSPYPVFLAFLPATIIVIVPDKRTYDYLSRYAKVRHHGAD